MHAKNNPVQLPSLLNFVQPRLYPNLCDCWVFTRHYSQSMLWKAGKGGKSLYSINNGGTIERVLENRRKEIQRARLVDTRRRSCKHSCIFALDLGNAEVAPP
jgi:hypothetical protein